MSRFCSAVACLVLAASQASAQLLTGVVTDTSTGRPLSGAMVSLTGGARATRTDELGQFAIKLGARGEIALELRRIGYAVRRLTVTVPEGVERFDVRIAMQRVAALDTVQVRAADRAVYGVVAASKDMSPLRNADVQLLGSRLTTKTDSNGRFFVPLKTGQTFVVRAKVEGYTPQMMSITVPDKSGLEVALLLDSATSPFPRRIEMALSDFDQRAMWRNNNNSAVVPRMELMRQVDAPLLHALRSAPSFVGVSMRFIETVCVFVDGVFRPEMPMTAFDMADIEFVETYADTAAPAARELMRSIPRPFLPCSSRTGVPGGIKARGRNTSDEVKIVVIWTKR